MLERTLVFSHRPAPNFVISFPRLHVKILGSLAVAALQSTTAVLSFIFLRYVRWSQVDQSSGLLHLFNKDLAVQAGEQLEIGSSCVNSVFRNYVSDLRDSGEQFKPARKVSLKHVTV